MSDALELTTSQQFEIERMGRAIDATEDIESLKKLSKQLVSAWFTQKAATLWALHQQLDPPGACTQALEARQAGLREGQAL